MPIEKIKEAPKAATRIELISKLEADVPNDNVSSNPNDQDYPPYYFRPKKINWGALLQKKWFFQVFSKVSQPPRTLLTDIKS